jgi:hypothetical protein
MSKPTASADAATAQKWRFGYGSNLGLKTLREKKNLSVARYLVGTIKGYELCKNIVCTQCCYQTVVACIILIDDA